MLAYWLNKLFNYDFIEDEEGLIARVYFDKNEQLPFYYNTHGLMVYVQNPLQVNWLTCKPSKYSL